jgi:hypothetical protein
MSIFGNSRMQIRKLWLNQLKNFFNKRFKEFGIFLLVNPNHCNLEDNPANIFHKPVNSVNKSRFSSREIID